jgi:hypothetical protein
MAAGRRAMSTSAELLAFMAAHFCFCSSSRARRSSMTPMPSSRMAAQASTRSSSTRKGSIFSLSRMMLWINVDTSER